MRELIFELLLRLVKPLGATVAGLVAWMLATGPGSATGSPELAILCWIAGAAFVLMVSEGPI